MKLIGITGLKRSGKDSLATIINNYSDGVWNKVSFADPMREIMYHLCSSTKGTFDYETHKEEVCLKLDDMPVDHLFTPLIRKMCMFNASTPEIASENGSKFLVFLGEFKDREFSPREFLQKLGTEFGRKTLGEDIWVELLLSSLDPNKNYIVPDVRFDNEANAIRRYDGYNIHVTRLSHPDSDKSETDKHESEKGINPELVDLFVEAIDMTELKRMGILALETLYPELDIVTGVNIHESIVCNGCEDCSGGDENLQEYIDPIPKD